MNNIISISDNPFILEWPAGTGPPLAFFCRVWNVEISETNTLVRSFQPSTWCYIWHDFDTITSEFHPAAGFNLMRNIIPNGFWPQKQSGTSRSAAFLNRALWFSGWLLTYWHDWNPQAVKLSENRPRAGWTSSGHDKNNLHLDGTN